MNTAPIKLKPEDCTDLDKCIEWVDQKFKGILDNLLKDADKHKYMPPKTKEELKAAFEEDQRIWLAKDEDSAVGELHFSMGAWLRNELELWKESAASKFFNSCGIYHADDMSSIILASYHRKHTGKNIKLDEQVKRYIDFWEERDPDVNLGKM